MTDHQDAWWYSPFFSSLLINFIFNNFTPKKKSALILQHIQIVVKYFDLREHLFQKPSTAYTDQWTRTSLKLSREALKHSVCVQIRFSEHRQRSPDILSILPANMLIQSCWLSIWTFAHGNHGNMLTFKSCCFYFF